MARSGSYSFTVDRDTLIKRAMQNINIINVNQVPRGADLEFAVHTLQMLIKFLQARGIQLWNRRQAVLFPDYQDEQYLISHSASSAHSANSYLYTTTSTTINSGVAVIPVASSSGMTIGDNIGVTLSDKSRQWSTIASVDSATQVTMAATLTASVASGAIVVTHTSQIADRPLRILDARTVDLNANKNSISMELISYDEYFNIPIKTTNGRPLNYYYDKLLDAGNLYLFPRPDDVDMVVEFTYHEEMEDVNSSTDNFDIPAEWMLPLQDQLEYRLAIYKGKFQELPFLKQKADESLAVATEFDNDEEPLFILPTGFDNRHK